MGSYTFKWEHPANEVFVTGTFDDWAKSVRLDRNGSVFEKNVNLPRADEKILYKFVVDGNWTTSHTHPIETDEHNNQNNVLHPSEIAKHQPATETASNLASHTSTAASHAASNIASGSSVAASEIASNFSAAKMAGQERSEHAGGSSAIPGAFPETPANELSSFNTPTPAKEASEFSVNPIPASEGHGNPFSLRPGEKVPNFNAAGVNKNVHDDLELKAKDEEKSQTFGVAPLPATGGAGNPIHLQPGEKVPHHSEFTTNTTTSNVRLDKASYEKSDAGVPMLPPVVTPENERDATGGMFGLPGITGTMIPESSLPMGAGTSSTEKDLGPHIQSAHPYSTTAALAAQVPKEPRVPSAAAGVPEVVADSQKEARVYPEAAANPEAVEEKKQLEQELLQKVPKEPAASDTRVPEVVTDSQKAAHAEPEATASPIAVAEKREVEEELLHKVPTQPATSGETTIAGTAAQGASVAKDTALKGAAVAGSVLASAGATIASYATTAKDKALETKDQAVENYQSGALTENLPNTSTVTSRLPDTSAVTSRLPDTSAVTSHLPASVQDAINRMNTTGVTPESTTTGLAGDVPTEPRGMHVPEVVSESIAEAHVSPEATANPEALDEKTAVERELLSSIPTTNETGEPAPKLEKDLVPSAAVPDVVAESISAAHASPEAAANTEAVVEKKELERELLSSIPPATEGGEPAPSLAPALSATAPGDKPIVSESSGLSPNSLVDNEPLKSSSEVGLSQPTETPAASYQPIETPAVSYQPIETPVASHQPIETPVAFHQPTETYTTSTQPTNKVEVVPYDSTPFAPAGTAASTQPAETSTSATTTGLNQPTEAPAQSAATEIGQLSAQTPSDSRDVSPMSRPATTNQTQPMVTTGISTGETAKTSEPSSSKAAAAPVTPSKSPAQPTGATDTPESTRTSMSQASENGGKDKKHKRRSFFGKLKDKLGGHH